MSARVYINAAAACCPLGQNIAEIEGKLFTPEVSSPLHLSEDYADFATRVGTVPGDLPEVLPRSEASRNNQLLLLAMQDLKPVVDAALAQYGNKRVGLVLGTSTSGVAEAERALEATTDGYVMDKDYDYATQELYAPTRFAKQYFGIEGPCWTVSSACTSGGKALTAAARLLKLGVCDAVIAGGVDSLCRMTVGGFSSLNVTTTELNKPFSANRQGINIGESAALFVLSGERAPVELCGWGETSDAYHISSPHPEGLGAEQAMRQALDRAGIDAADVGYLNLHGTGTAQNDAMEAAAVKRVFGSRLPCSSTKPLTGHTLAAAGAIEAAFLWLSLQRSDGRLPIHLWDGVRDEDIDEVNLVDSCSERTPLNIAMSNSFAFGGSNVSLLMAAVR